MAMRRPLGQLASDLRSGMSLATERVAYEVTRELIELSPEWTGEFRDNWVVKAGQVRIEADKEASYPRPDRGDRPMTWSTTPTPVVPIADDSLRGYTIGNRMEYADIAMDLMPAPDGYRWEREGASARRDWFERYILGRDAQQTIATATRQAMRTAGFVR